MYSWERIADPGICDQILEMSFNGQKSARLHFYKGTGYFAYLFGHQLNHIPIESLMLAMDLVHSAHISWYQQESGKV